MKQWKGLVFKEWMPRRKQFYWSAAALLLALITVPAVLQRVVLHTSSIFQITFTVCMIWAAFSVAAPSYYFIKSIQKELQRPDVWLHSTASVSALISAKMVPGLLAGAASMVITGAVLGFHFLLNGVGEFGIQELAVIGSAFLLLLFLVSIFILAGVYLFFTLHLLFRPYVKSLSLPIVFALTILTVRLYGVLAETTFYQMISHFGKVELDAMNPLHWTSSTGEYEMMDSYQYNVDFFTGELLLDTALCVLMFAAASLLFEKKVRL